MLTAVEIAVRTVLAVVFGVAFLSKVASRRRFQEFSSSLGGIGWLRGQMRTAVAAIIPVLEAATVILLIAPVSVLWGCAASGVLVAAFTSVAGRELARGNLVLCRCFGAGTSRIGSAQIARNLLLLACSVTGMMLAFGREGRASAAGLVLAIGLALPAGLALVRWDDLAELVRAR
jgi:hypothetical protein